MSGLHFHKLDLHVHTPASKCYLDKKQTAAQIVQAALDMGLHGIAITDHNNAAWIDEMKKAAADKGLVFFPVWRSLWNSATLSQFLIQAQLKRTWKVYSGI